MRTKCSCCARMRDNPDEKLCSECLEKRNILRSKGRIFEGQTKPQKSMEEGRRQGLERLYRSGYRRLGVYDSKHGMRMGVGTKKVIDFVNNHGSIHYGRQVALCDSSEESV